MEKFITRDEITNEIDYDLWVEYIIAAIITQFPDRYEYAMTFFHKEAGKDWTQYLEAMCEMIDSYATSGALNDFSDFFIKRKTTN